MNYGEILGWVVAVVTLIVMLVQMNRDKTKDKTSEEKSHSDKHSGIESAIKVLQTNYENIERRMEEISKQIDELRGLVINVIKGGKGG